MMQSLPYSVPSTPLRRTYSNISRKFSSDCGTILGDRDYIGNYDSDSRVEVDNFVANHIVKINNLLDSLERKTCVSENKMSGGDKFNIFQFIKSIPKWAYNKLEDIRLERNKKELLNLINCEIEQYLKGFERIGDSDEIIDLDKTRLLIDRYRVDSVLEILVKINKKVKEIEARPSLGEVVSSLMDAIVPLLSMMVGYTAASIPLVSIFLFSILCLHYLSKFFVNFKRNFSYEDSQKNKHNEWIASIRKIYTPRVEEKVIARQLMNKFEGAEDLETRQRQASISALTEGGSSIYTPISTRPSSPVITRMDHIPVRNRCASLPFLNLPGRQADGLGSGAPIAHPQPRSSALQWTHFNEAFVDTGSSFTKDDLVEMPKGSAQEPPKKPFPASFDSKMIAEVA